MPLVTLDFDNPLNVSCQVGDTAYYVATGSDGGFTTNGSNSIVEVGTILQITTQNSDSTFNDRVIVNSPTIDGFADTPANFILFSKDNKANLSSPLGYYASVKMTNNSTTEAELFSVGMDTFVSSK